MQAYEKSMRGLPGLLLGSVSGTHMIIAAVCPIAAVPSQPVLADLGCMERAYCERAGVICQLVLYAKDENGLPSAGSWDASASHCCCCESQPAKQT